jgi:hypothetical protein
MGVVEELPNWPAAFACVFREAISKMCLENLTADIHGIAACPNFWVPKVGTWVVYTFAC